jgi:hypothetical protein
MVWQHIVLMHVVVIAGRQFVWLVKCTRKVSHVYLMILRKIFEVVDICKVLPSQMHG